MKSHESKESIEREDDLAALPNGVYLCDLGGVKVRRRGHESTLDISLMVRGGDLNHRIFKFRVKGEIKSAIDRTLS